MGLRGERIETYPDPEGAFREILKIELPDHSFLVIDRDLASRAEVLLVGRIGSDEETSNCELLARLYLADLSRRAARAAVTPPARRPERPGRRERLCRALEPADLRSPEEEPASGGLPHGPVGSRAINNRSGGRVALELRASPVGLPQLRWVNRSERGAAVLSLRELVGRLESYEPVRSLTVAAIGEHHHGCGYSVSVLRAECERLDRSPIVLNRALREAVRRAVAQAGLSMSEIALRCGRVKLDRHGKPSGEASCLGRRIGVLPEAGAPAPTPWVHTDVLALIARRGLALSPREVEL